jgi:hypothetical protein
MTIPEVTLTMQSTPTAPRYYICDGCDKIVTGMLRSYMPTPAYAKSWIGYHVWRLWAWFTYTKTSGVYHKACTPEGWKGITIELGSDLKAYHGLVCEEELTQQLAAQLRT